MIRVRMLKTLRLPRVLLQRGAIREMDEERAARLIGLEVAEAIGTVRQTVEIPKTLAVSIVSVPTPKLRPKKKGRRKR